MLAHALVAFAIVTLYRLTLLLRLRHGIQADETAFLLADFWGATVAEPSLEPCSSLGRIVRGGITRWHQELERTKETVVLEMR